MVGISWQEPKADHKGSALWRVWACPVSLHQGLTEPCAEWLWLPMLVAVSWCLWMVILELVQQEQDKGAGDRVLRLEAFLAGLKCWVRSLEGLLALGDGVPSKAGETGPGSVRSKICGSAGKWMLMCDQLKATLARYMTVCLKLDLEFADLQSYAL